MLGIVYKLHLTMSDGKTQTVEFVVPRGPKGEPGHDPVKGVDYWTPEDVDEIETRARESIIVGADVISVTEDRILQASDAGKFLRVDKYVTITIPSDVFEIGDEIEVFRNTSSIVTIRADGVSFAIIGNDDLITTDQKIQYKYSSVILKHIDTNVWTIQGAV